MVPVSENQKYTKTILECQLFVGFISFSDPLKEGLFSTCLFFSVIVFATFDRCYKWDCSNLLGCQVFHKVSLAHNVSFWAEKLHHLVSFLAQK